ncbi:MAG TPA: amidohydrolase family protein [Thermoanaerobaculia bacterium]|jgi:imidazolonepropionase-like amidohydrolase|nr:amidohydrolase family protein [Thermoanaerobaculia bacterium]
MLKRALPFLFLAASALAQEQQQPYAPDRRPDEGEGPFKRLIIRGATVIEGSGAPPIGPMDIVIEGNRITEIRSVGFPKVPIDPERRPALIPAEGPKDATKEIDGSKMYVLPGFVDMHGHPGGTEQGTTAEYVFKLWLAHGITTVRDPGSGNGLEWTIHERDRSAKNEIVAPRIVPYAFTGRSMWKGGAIDSPEQARKFVQSVAKNGGAGLKIIGAGGGGDPIYDPDILAALIDEAKKHKLGTTTHLAQLGVARMNILQAARLGLGSMEHWYGLPESLFAERTIQDYPADYNYLDEQHRFGQAGRLWRQAAPPGSAKWNAVMDELLQLKFTIDPTFTIYEASRDLSRAMRAEWHDRYTLPSLWKWYEPSRKAHGSYWFDWTTRDEIEWKNNYRLWMTFINEYKNRGGRVTTGSDSGYIYKLYGFDYIRELELLQEAGFHPLEVIRAATFHGAETLAEPTGKKAQFGLVRTGMLADLVLVEENPLANLKVLYGTGAIRVNDETGKVERVGGVKYVVKDGIVYDAKKLLADVEKIVADAKK